MASTSRETGSSSFQPFEASFKNPLDSSPPTSKSNGQSSTSAASKGRTGSGTHGGKRMELTEPMWDTAPSRERRDREKEERGDRDEYNVLRRSRSPSSRKPLDGRGASQSHRHSDRTSRYELDQQNGESTGLPYDDDNSPARLARREKWAQSFGNPKPIPSVWEEQESSSSRRHNSDRDYKRSGGHRDRRDYDDYEERDKGYRDTYEDDRYSSRTHGNKRSRRHSDYRKDKREHRDEREEERKSRYDVDPHWGSPRRTSFPSLDEREKMPRGSSPEEGALPSTSEPGEIVEDTPAPTPPPVTSPPRRRRIDKSRAMKYRPTPASFRPLDASAFPEAPSEDTARNFAARLSAPLPPTESAPPPPPDYTPPVPPLVNQYTPQVYDDQAWGASKYDVYDYRPEPPAPNRNLLQPSTRAPTPKPVEPAFRIVGPPKGFAKLTAEEELKLLHQSFKGTNSIEAYKQGSKLGEGTFGSVVMVRRCES